MEDREHGGESPINIDNIKGCRKLQRVDQCCHGAVDENDDPVQKATGIASNIKLKKTARRCSGHNGRKHAQLKGAVNGIPTTAAAAAYPRTLCQRLKLDIMHALKDRGLLEVRPWPRDLFWFNNESFYECVRCSLGRSCPPGIEHSLIPGKCRHGKWPEGEGPRAKKKAKQEEDPVQQWKRISSMQVMTVVELQFQLPQGISIENSNHLKKLLAEIVNTTLGIFNEAVARRMEYHHWVEDPVQLGVMKEIFSSLMQVKGIRVDLRAFTTALPEPQLTIKSAPLRLLIAGRVKKWIVGPLEDMRELSHSQLHREIDEDDWLITCFGDDVGVPSPSTPATHHRKNPEEKPLPPSTSTTATNDDDRDPTAEEPSLVPEEDEPFQLQKPEAARTIKPNYSIRRVLDRLPKLVEQGDNHKSKQLLLGLHERMWHCPIQDFRNLLTRAGMPQEVLDLASTTIQECSVCRRYVRLPNRPQLRVGSAISFNECCQLDLFHLDNQWFIMVIDEATRYKVCDKVDSQEPEELLSRLLDRWIRYFGPMGKLVMDQQTSLMGHDVGGEFERLGISRKPKGTTSGDAAKQHTSTGLVERHIGLIKITIKKIKAELERQSLTYDLGEIASEAAMAQNMTMSYHGVTPSMAVFGVPPRDFYEHDNTGILAVTGALQTDLSTFERAMRIRQTSLAQVQQAIIEDRIARAARARPHQLDQGLIAGTSEVEYYRDDH